MTDLSAKTVPTGESVTGVDEALIHQARYLLLAMDKTADGALPNEIAEIVKFHSKAAAATALASAWIPGGGGVAAALISAGFIWTMYGRIGTKIGVPFGKNVLKSLASGAATNLAGAVVGSVAISTALSLIPGLGSVGASVIMGATAYAICLASGYIYLKILTRVFAKGSDYSTLSEQELKDMIASAAKESDVQEIIKGAKADFRTMNKQGAFN